MNLSFSFLILLVFLFSICILATFFALKLSAKVKKQRRYIVDLEKHKAMHQAKHLSSEDQLKKVNQTCAQKMLHQKKELKALFVAEYNKLASKYKHEYNKLAIRYKEVLTKGQDTASPQSASTSQALMEVNKSLEEAQALLIRSEKMSSLGQLTAGIAHEINNPVNFVANGIDTLKNNISELNLFIENYRRICEQETIEEVKKYYKIQREDDHHFLDLQTSTQESLDDIAYGTTRITEIVNGLRGFSRQDDLKIREADLNQILENATVILKPKYKKKAKILKHFDPSIPPINCLPGQLNQALVNLIGNACDAIDFKGTIQLKTENSDEDHVKISIKDDGKGMPEEILQKIFDPFFTTKEVGQGTGLGLSITYGIIEKHNGKIEVESEEGKGTEFTVILPKKLETIKKAEGPTLT